MRRIRPPAKGIPGASCPASSPGTALTPTLSQFWEREPDALPPPARSLVRGSFSPLWEKVGMRGRLPGSQGFLHPESAEGRRACPLDCRLRGNDGMGSGAPRMAGMVNGFRAWTSRPIRDAPAMTTRASCFLRGQKPRRNDTKKKRTSHLSPSSSKEREQSHRSAQKPSPAW